MSFVRYIPRPVEGLGTSLDFNGLASLRQKLRTDTEPKAAQQQVAQQFEALFIQLMLKQARQASVATPLLDGEPVRMAQALNDEQTALGLANPGLGLAQALFEQLRATASPTGVAKAVRNIPGHVRAFIDKLADSASLVARHSGIPEKLILSQAALESGWGRREIRHEDGSGSFNLFGIKAGAGWSGKVANVVTTEYVDGKPQKLIQAFRAYGSYMESFSDYARLITQSARYRGVTQTDCAQEAARRIQDAGYATDPEYANKLISIMSYFDADH
ncbi:flagellar assembly peptidoglycan hydrolase FlgJ [Allopusillimonas ginsengisoli]|uniref:flagellar assembly peptidoglycan hydrolase FlgJ n=1 Tax=Allopusillimonas ginsengisoli TaxID=453575 RepID=UPI001022333C|nr:flagellar assembly peptidoglycan hydrolase FlgJ [Allopusillimonas ginsengisoli]TEA79408.1 flagellar assembly peptidoglycan hydrolase FlgJ [Allopusillimonas ginsengisoli]